jgi:oligoribonuclease NrnB/cAMP/cGMP phosphodiesterase (DHH superfamily)
MKSFPDFLTEFRANPWTEAAVIYHHPCIDGSAAKWAAQRAFSWVAPKATVEYIGTNYGKPISDKVTAPTTNGGRRWVFILDFSYPREVLEELVTRPDLEVVVLDHHKTAAAALAGLECALFDMNKSGAVLAWEYFLEPLGEGKPPGLTLRVQDRDLWRWQYGDTKEINCLAEMAGDDFHKWEGLHQSYRDHPNPTFKEGRKVVEYKELVVEKSLFPENVSLVTFSGFKTAVMNTQTLQSETCNELLKRLDVQVALAWTTNSDGSLRVSLRSKQGSGVDVSAIAKEYGGGGHENAAGINSAPIGILNLWYPSTSKAEF